MVSIFYSHFAEAHPAHKIQDLRCSWANELHAVMCFEGSLRNPLLKFYHQPGGGRDNIPPLLKSTGYLLNQSCQSWLIPHAPKNHLKEKLFSSVITCSTLQSGPGAYHVQISFIYFVIVCYWPVSAAQCLQSRSVQKSFSDIINHVSIWSSLPSQWFRIWNRKIISILARG